MDFVIQNVKAGSNTTITGGTLTKDAGDSDEFSSINGGMDLKKENQIKKT